MVIKSLVRALSGLLVIVAGFMTLCLAAGLAVGEGMAAFSAFGPSVGIGFGSLAVSIVFLRVKNASLSHRTGYLFVVLAWILSTIIGAMPFLIDGSIRLFVDAFFETMSGFTTRLSQTAKMLWLIFLAMASMLTILLMLGGRSWLHALTHSCGTMGPGGFSTRNASVGAFNSIYFDIAITTFMMLLGRLEVYTVLVLFTKTFWKR